MFERKICVEKISKAEEHFRAECLCIMLMLMATGRTDQVQDGGGGILRSD